ncbi:hypothetical protein PENSUB_9003 [Penicillium subrubescens]|uniref:Beta-glucuronidase C-terminal domain-containing protein n=1 Tax=Penicillium subrubescens TaxID=1316194 RepID=A0A1Q5TEY4_9EURO|nr:hypothetical protein PENSUB_9003 [Penicillium subrubescens]
MEFLIWRSYVTNITPPMQFYLWQNKADAVIPWNASQEGADAANWAQGFIDAWKSPLPILTAGSYAVSCANYNEWPNTDYLIDTAYNDTRLRLAIFAERVFMATFVNRSFILGEHIVELDSGNGSYAQYVIYSKGRPTKAVLVNTDYFSGSGVRTKSTIRLNGLVNSRVKAVRMTAASSEVTTNGTASYPIIGVVAEKMV